MEARLLSKGDLVHPLDSGPPRLPNVLPCGYECLVRLGATGVRAGDVPPNEPLVRARKAFTGEGLHVVFDDIHVEFWTHTRLGTETQEEKQ